MSHIDSDDKTFRITTHRRVDDLIPTIRRMGILHPPLVRAGKTAYQIIAGFRRIDAAKQLDCHRIPVMHLSGDESELDCARYAVADNSLNRELNPVEQAIALSMLSRLVPGESHLYDEARELNLPHHPSAIDKVIQIATVCAPIKNGILAGSIALPVALELGKMSEHDAMLFVELFGKLKLSLNKQREVLVWVREIALREDISVQQVYEQPALQSLLGDDQSDLGQRARDVRDHLRKRRYPQLVTAEKKYEEKVKALKLGAGLRLLPPPFFEGRTYQLSMTFKDVDQLAERHRTIGRLLSGTVLEDLIT